MVYRGLYVWLCRVGSVCIPSPLVDSANVYSALSQRCMLSEYSVYEIQDEGDEPIEQPGESPRTNHIGMVEAHNLYEAYDVALGEFGSPVAVE